MGGHERVRRLPGSQNRREKSRPPHLFFDERSTVHDQSQLSGRKRRGELQRQQRRPRKIVGPTLQIKVLHRYARKAGVEALANRAPGARPFTRTVTRTGQLGETITYTVGGIGMAPVAPVKGCAIRAPQRNNVVIIALHGPQVEARAPDATVGGGLFNTSADPQALGTPPEM